MPGWADVITREEPTMRQLGAAGFLAADHLAQDRVGQIGGEQ